MISSPMSTEAQTLSLARIAEEKMAQFLKLMDRWETVDWKTVKHINTTAVWEHKEKDEIFEIIRKNTDPLNYKRPADVDGLEYRLLRVVPRTFLMAEKYTGATGIGSMIFETSSISDDYEYYDKDLPIKGYNEGNFGRLSGPPRQGKTNFACVQIERWTDKKRVYLTNIAKKEETNVFIHCKDARSLFENLCTIQRQTKVIFGYDEAGLTDSKAHASTLHARYMNDLYRVWGKFWGNALYIDQLYTKCPEFIESVATNIYHAIQPGTIYFELSGDYEFRRALTNFPKTTLPYDTRDLAYFDSRTLNVEAMFASISGITNEKERFDAMRDFLKSPASYPKNTAPKVKKEKKEEEQEEEETLADWIRGESKNGKESGLGNNQAG